MSLNDALLAADIKTALIVDDAYDPVPTSADVQLEAEEWTFFFDDLLDEQKDFLRVAFPQFDLLQPDQLAASDEFVKILWNNRAKIGPEQFDRLFSRYEAEMAADLELLRKLQAQLEALGISCETSGRDFEDKAKDPDLIVIDLFLSSRQDAGTLDLSKTALARVVARRRAAPPMVVLMSRSGRLEQKREEFRDEVRLLESGFRIIKKSELEIKLTRILTLFALHREDFARLAAFLDAWEGGVQAAAARAAALMRRLDLSDFGQIQQLLLSAEGELPGNYIVDVFDRVLQHEVEREADLITAAIDLKGLTSKSYPPPHVAGSRDLQTLMYRTLFQHPERLRLSGSEGSKVAFGDVLRMSSGLSKRMYPVVGTSTDNVFVVLTPACDLQREAAQRLMLLVGTLKPLGAKDWKIGEDPVRTSVAELDGTRFWIHWDLKFVESMSHARLTAALEKNRLRIVGRLREAHALELQQKLLSNLGRVGMPAMMPATFQVKVEICYLNADRQVTRLEVPGLDAGGVCFMGREPVEGKPDESKDSSRLVLSEPLVDAVVAAIAALDPNLVIEGAREALQFLKENEDLSVILTKSLKLAGPGSRLKIQSVTDTEGNGRTIGFVTRNGDRAAQLSNADVRRAGVMIFVDDLN